MISQKKKKTILIVVAVVIILIIVSVVFICFHKKNSASKFNSSTSQAPNKNPPSSPPSSDRENSPTDKSNNNLNDNKKKPLTSDDKIGESRGISSENKDKNLPSPTSTSNEDKLEFVSTKIDNNTFKYHFQQGDSKMSFSAFLSALKIKDSKFFSVFQGALKDANTKLSAYFWECVPVSKNTLNKGFEFVVTKSQELAQVKQDYSSFQENIDKARNVKVSPPNTELEKELKYSTFFPNLRGDASLIIPIPQPGKDYKNISQFTKNAQFEQQQYFWKKVAERMQEFWVEIKYTGDTTLWLSTHGLGVPYLHVRIDTAPKYYHHVEYKID